MREFKDDLLSELKEEEKEVSFEELKYDTSYFVSVSSNFKKWFIKNIDMSAEDQDIILENLDLKKKIFVEPYKTEDRDPEFIYKFEAQGLLLSTQEIRNSFTNGEIQQELEENNDLEKMSYESIRHTNLTIENYEGNNYPPNDEVDLIVHRINYKDISLLLFCNQIRTTLAKTTLKTIVNNQLQNAEKDKLYRIKNDISFILTPENYFITSIEYFERLFSFESYTKLMKEKALASLKEADIIEGFEKIEKELNKGYMARSLAKINFSEKELKKFVKVNQEAISKYCSEYQVGVKFDIVNHTFEVIDEGIAPLFITYLFSERVAENILGDLVYYKSFNKLNKSGKN